MIHLTREAREAMGWEFDGDHRLARMYWGAGALPPRSHIEGTIRRPDGRTGALIQYNHTRVYVQGNAGCTFSLDQNAIKDLLGEAGALARDMR